MNLQKVDQFPYILDAWEKHLTESKNEKMCFDGVSKRGLSRAEIDDEASRLYAYLKKNGISKEDFVMICLPRCAEVVCAMLGVWKAGASFTIVDSHYSEDRIKYIYDNCNCKLMLDMETWGQAMKEDPISGYENTDPHDACFAVYTSGSTGNPKGVLHEYGELKMIGITAIKPYDEFWYKGGCRFGLIPPLNFVAALKFIVYGIYSGFRIYIIPIETVKNPAKLKKYYLDNKITDSHLAPSVIRAAGNDFGPYLKRVITGSEPPNGITFKNGDITNNYTMSESGFVIAQYLMEEKEDSVPVGKPNFDEVTIRLLDENGEDVSDGEAGEICFEHPYFRGYIKMPEETKAAKRGGVFHTGDLGKKREDGNFVIVGRMNDMIKINGNRVEPAEIERQAKKILGIEWCCAKGFVDEDKAFLCLYYTADIKFDVVEVKRKFGEVLPYYMVPSYYIKIDEIPLLPNNKINKKALPKPDTSSYRAEYEAPENEYEKKLCEAFEKVLEIPRVGRKDDFFALGGDSLSAMELLEFLDWNQLSSADIYNGITVERIASLYIKNSSDSTGISPEEYEMEARKIPHRLTEHQIYVVDTTLFKPSAFIWNMLSLFRVSKDNIGKVRDAINTVIKNSPICSTLIYFDEDYELRQRYDPERCPFVEIEETTDEEFARTRNELGVHTNVINTPLYIFRIFETESCGYVFLNRHHFGSDGMSKILLFRRIVDAYNGKELPLDTYYSYLQYKEDFPKKDEYTAGEKYFRERYADTDWSFELRKDQQLGEKGAAPCFRPLAISKEELGRFEKRAGITRNLLSSMALLLTLSVMNSKKDVLILYTYNNRSDRIKNEAMGGLFINLPLAAKFDSYRNLSEFYDDMKLQVSENIRHSDFDWYELILKDKMYETVIFTYEDMGIMGSSDALKEIDLEEEDIFNKDAYFITNSLLAQIREDPMGFMSAFFYRYDYYQKETIENFAGLFSGFIKEMLSIEVPKDVSVEELISRVKNEHVS